MSLAVNVAFEGLMRFFLIWSVVFLAFDSTVAGTRATEFCASPVEVVPLTGKEPPADVQPWLVPGRATPPSHFISYGKGEGPIERLWRFDGRRLVEYIGTEFPAHQTGEQFATSADGLTLGVNVRQRGPSVIFVQDRVTRRFERLATEGAEIEWARHLIWSESFGAFLIGARSGLYLLDLRQTPARTTQIAPGIAHLRGLLDLPRLRLAAVVEAPDNTDTRLYVVGPDVDPLRLDITEPTHHANLHIAGEYGGLIYEEARRGLWSGVTHYFWQVPITRTADGLEVDTPVLLGSTFGRLGRWFNTRWLVIAPAALVPLNAPGSGRQLLWINGTGELLVNDEGRVTVLRFGQACASQ